MRRLLVSFLLLLISVYAKPQSSEAYVLGVDGIKEVEAGNYKEGIRLLKQARKLEPNQYDYTFEIGRAYFESGNAKMAEKFLYPLQYHINVQPDLYIFLAKCYQVLNEQKKTPDEQRKKELNALRYGIQKLPDAGQLYLELGNRKLELDEPIKALAVYENGIANAPNFADNYFWAAKLLKATGNELWSWIYAETFFNLTDNERMRRTAALMIQEATETVFSGKWKAEPEQMDQELRFLLESKCKTDEETSPLLVDKRKCVVNEWSKTDFPISVLMNRMKLLEQKGFFEAYLATIYLESDKSKFLPWLAEHAEEYDAYIKWRYWNPITLEKPIKRI